MVAIPPALIWSSSTSTAISISNSTRSRCRNPTVLI